MDSKTQEHAHGPLLAGYSDRECAQLCGELRRELVEDVANTGGHLASNLGSLFTALRAGYVLVGVGLISSVASILGHYIGAGLAIKNGSKIVRPTVIAVLLLLTVKVGSELLFPEFWS